MADLRIASPAPDIKSSPSGFQQGALVFAASVGANILDYLLHMVISRNLGPGDYSIVTSLLATFIILMLPATMLQTVTARYLSQFQAQGELRKLRDLFLASLKTVSIFGLAITVIFLGLSQAVASYLQIPSLAPVLVVATFFLPGFWVPISTGALQGLQRFRALSINMLLGAASRLGFGAAFVFLGFGAAGALAASSLASLTAFVAALTALAYLFREPREPHGIRTMEIFGYSARSFSVLLCFAALTNMDVILVRHYFPPVEAGFYSAAAILGKIIFVFPGAVNLVMFPKSSHNHALGRDSASIARATALVTAGLCGVVVAGYFLLPQVPVLLLFGREYLPAVPLVGLYGLAMSLYALGNMLLFYYLSINSRHLVKLLAACAAFQLITLLVMHPSLQTVVMVLIATSSLLIAGSEVFCEGIMVRQLVSALRRPRPQAVELRDE